MLQSLAQVRPEERRGVAAAFLTLFGILAGHTLLETARDALFLARLPPSRLPWMYLAIAALAFGLERARPRRLSSQLAGRYGLSALLLAAAAVTLGFWRIRSDASPAALYALYVWSGLFGTTAAIRFWLTLSDIYTVTQAKRVYRLIGAGSVLGAVTGAGLAGAVAVALPARYLLLASAALLGLTGLGPALLLGRRTDGSSGAAAAPSLTAAARLVRDQPYVRSLAGLLLSSTIAVTLADFLFKSAVARSVPAESLATFFALVSVVLNGAALLVQLFVAGFLMGRLGVHRTLWVLPALLALGSLGLLVSGAFLAALWLKAADGSLRHSVHRTATELLYVPLPDSVRARVKPFLDLAGQRGGQALASLLILTPVAFVPREAFLCLALSVLAVLWILSAADLKQHYLDLFRAALREGGIATRPDLPSLDLASLEALFAALNSRDDLEVTSALDLLAEQGKTGLIPALVLYHPSKPVVLRAFDLFVAAKRSDFLPIADRLLSHADPEVRAAALRARSAIATDEPMLSRAARDESPSVRAAAVVGLVGGGWITDEAQGALDALLDSQSPAAGRALARAIREQPGPVFQDVLLDLAEAPEEEVLVEVARAMGAMPAERFLPALLPMLAQRDVRNAAREAFLAHDAAGLRFLDDALGDHALPQELRRHLPRTISQFGADQAAPVLLKHLLGEPDGMVRFKILRGLGRLKADNPALKLDPSVLARATALTVEAAFRLIHWRRVLEAAEQADARRRTHGLELLVALLRDKETHAVERLFRLLGLQYPGEDLRRIYRGLQSDSPRLRASSRELLENLVPPPLRDALLALVDDAPAHERLARAQPYYTPAGLDYEALLAVMIERGSESLRCLAAHHVAELGLTSFRPRLQELRARETGFFVTRVLERALAMLELPGRAQRA